VSESIGFSLARGGFFYTLLRRAGLWRDDHHDIRRQSVALVLLTWMPLSILVAIEGLRRPEPFWLIVEPSVHVRLLVAIPFFVWAERSLDWRSADAVDLFVSGRFADDAAVERILGNARRLRDSWWPELVFLGTAIVVSQLSLWRGTVLPGFMSRKLNGAEALSPTHLWYALVALPIFQLLLGRIFWRWVIWSRLLLQFSRLRLRLVPTHPESRPCRRHRSSR
jgi:hypothetical protein